ncbi:MAG TPA: helix-turn-helix domain-containing protein, partial [Anaerolineae bacterium]|nr:helix-turn-helix domain-containing protein [Anaerolineae bacterium]
KNAMQDDLYIETADQALTLLKPLRIELLKRMDEPRTCPELASYFDETPQKIYYHVKALERAGLVEKMAERRVRGVVEGYYQAKARSYWLAPRLLGELGGQRLTQDQMSLHFLLSLAAEVHDDIGRLTNRAEQEIPSLGLSAQIVLPDGNKRADFLQEVQTIFQDLARKYGSRGEDEAAAANEQMFRLVLACYPKDLSKGDSTDE